MISDKAMTILAMVASISLGTFVLVLILPPLLFGSTSPIVNFAGLEIVRLALFLFAMISLFGIGPFLIYQFLQKNRLKDATNHYVRNKLQVILLSLDLLETTPPGDYSREQELKKEIRDSITQLNDRIRETILNGGRSPSAKRRKTAMLFLTSVSKFGSEGNKNPSIILEAETRVETREN
jgi:hypothetical protein